VGSIFGKWILIILTNHGILYYFCNSGFIYIVEYYADNARYYMDITKLSGFGARRVTSSKVSDGTIT
jgi:hypothetical protein